MGIDQGVRDIRLTCNLVSGEIPHGYFDPHYLMICWAPGGPQQLEWENGMHKSTAHVNIGLCSLKRQSRENILGHADHGELEDGKISIRPSDLQNINTNKSS